MTPRFKLLKDNVRNVHSNGKTITGVIVNNQNEFVQFESGSEEILPLIFLRDRTIIRLISQPVVIAYYDLDGKLHAYTPDFLVERKDGSIELHEYTLSSRRLKPESIAREIAARKYCEERGWIYIVHTELEFPNPTWIDNIQALHGFIAQGYNNEHVRKEIMSLLKNGDKLTYSLVISEIQNILGIGKNVINGTVFHMLYWTDLCTDLNQLLFIQGHPNPTMKLWMEKETGVYHVN
jgi:hypothetical protein